MFEDGRAAVVYDINAGHLNPLELVTLGTAAMRGMPDLTFVQDRDTECP
jgi:hypothetical protein